MPSRIAHLRITTILGLLAGFALSPKLWLSSRLYPLTPVFSFVRPLRSPADEIVLFVLVALLIALMIAPRRLLWIAASTLLAYLALQDQSRWQPWFYQYVMMLAAIGLAGGGRHQAAINTCCLIVAATYIWSGFAKLNPSFATVIFPAFVEPFVRRGFSPAPWLVRDLAILTPILESITGVGLLFRRSRKVALFGAIAMHVFILMILGPFGRGFNPVIWPWNLAMIAFLLILFVRRGEGPATRDIAWGREFAFQKAVLIAFGFLPALSLVNRWDDYLSSALYTGHTNAGVIYFTDDAFEQLPDAIQDRANEEGPNRGSLTINDLSFDELNVPSYPQIRIYQSVARQVCGYVSSGSGIELVIQRKAALANSNRRESYRCSELE
jgi:hypothetical protein